MTTIMTASQQWASRPVDQRFISLHELGAKVGYDRDRSRATVLGTRKLRAEPSSDAKGMTITHRDSGRSAAPTHYAFGQLASLAGAPAGYLRTLPAPVAADCINFGLHVARDVEDIGLLSTRYEDDHSEIRAATGPNYGRIWNADVVNSTIKMFGDGRTGPFKVPGEFGKDVEITRANTTLYASDHDMFVFLADEEHRVQVGNRRNGQPGSLARGFFIWNSEVGAASMGAAFFLFDYVCCNRIVWGAQEYKEIRLRHTSGAPDKWLREITPVLTNYANAAAAPVEQLIAQAQQAKVEDDLAKFLKSRFGLSGAAAKDIEQAHVREEGRPIETMWDLTTGITAHAKTIDFQDQRVAMERIGGKVLDLVAN